MKGLWIATAVAAGVLLVGAVATAARVIAVGSFGDGTHVVGHDVKAGTYRSKGGDGCYWARLRNFSGGLSGIIANENASGPTLVTIAPTDKGFESNGCGTWTSNLARVTKSKTRFGEGEYIVGVDITPGTYHSPGGSCYWARLRDFGNVLSSIIANDNTTGSTIVTISAGDKGFESHGCGTWSRI